MGYLFNLRSALFIILSASPVTVATVFGSNSLVVTTPFTYYMQEKFAGKTIRLHFVLRDTDLYAFQFRDRPAF